MEKPIYLFFLYEALRQYLTRSSTKPELLLFSATSINVGLNGRTDGTPISHICCNLRDADFHLKPSELNAFKNKIFSTVVVWKMQFEES